VNGPTLLEQAELALDAADLTDRVLLDQGMFAGEADAVQVSLPEPDTDLARDVLDALHVRHLHLASYGFMVEGSTLEQLARGAVLAVVQAPNE